MATETADTATAKRPIDWQTIATVGTMALTQIVVIAMLVGWLRSDIHRVEQTVRDTRAELHTSIRETRAELRADIADLRTDLRADIRAVGERVTALDGRIRPLEDRMTRQEALLPGTDSPDDGPPPADTDDAAGD